MGGEPESQPKSPSNTDVSTEVRKSNFKRFENQTSRSTEIELQEVRKPNLQEFGNQTSRGSETELAEVREPNANYNNTNNTDLSYNNQSNQSEGKAEETIDVLDDVNAYIEIIKENIEYEHHMKYSAWQDKELYDELFEVICEVVCVKHRTVKIGGDDYPYELVKSKFLKLNSSHLEYVMERMKNTTTKITNIKAYMVTAIYNAPNTINHFYQQEVQHDMFGGGWHEKGIV